jgi:hypothetical protein
MALRRHCHSYASRLKIAELTHGVVINEFLSGESACSRSLTLVRANRRADQGQTISLIGAGRPVDYNFERLLV